MKCCIHQPQFLPWLGYLHKINVVDHFVFLDNVQFKKNEFQNRNKILVGGEPRWLTVPVSFKFGDSLKETRTGNDGKWQRKMCRTIELNYAKTPFFGEYGPGIMELIMKKWSNIAELNEASVRWLADCFDINTRMHVGSEFDDLDDHPTRRLIDICHGIGADTYVSGAGGRKYLETELFTEAGIDLEFQSFEHPTYTQHSIPDGSGFVSHLSAIDGLMNCGGGKRGREILNLN